MPRRQPPTGSDRSVHPISLYSSRAPTFSSHSVPSPAGATSVKSNPTIRRLLRTTAASSDVAIWNDRPPGTFVPVSADCPERDAVSAPHCADDRPAREPFVARLLYPGVHLPGDRVHARGLPRGRLRKLGLRQHRDASLVRLPCFDVEQIHLTARP